jgi:hypothetical protein
MKVILDIASVAGVVTQSPRVGTNISTPVKRAPGREPSVRATSPMEFAAYVATKCIGPASAGTVKRYLPDVWTKTHVPV